MTVIRNTLPQGVKTISFKYLISRLFDDVSLETLTMADKMDKGQSLADSDRVDEYGLTEDETYQFNNFLAEGHTKVFSKLLKMTHGLIDSIVLNFLPLTITPPVAKQVNIKLSGDMGSADIYFAPLGTLNLYYTTSLLATVGGFVIPRAAAFLEHGVVLSGATDTITFTAQVPGVDFPTPSITPDSPNLDGVVTVVTPNAVGETDDPHVSVTIRDKEGYNDNYVEVIDNEVYLALKNYILKEWYVKCLLGDQARYFEMKYIENMKAIQKYGLMLRKPRSVWSAPG